MSALILSAMKPVLTELLAKVKTGVPGAIDALAAYIAKMLPGTVDTLTAGFRSVYADVVTRLLAWVPTVKAPATVAANRALDLLGSKVIAKL
jgi:hypothetical protein